ncbi:MAG: chromate transporter [Oscillospiraceae bacterium]|jgi:chromate transporter|nr:chromate transporter [Oscillospiraceae bacterium]
MYLKLFISFVYIGTFTFGGGYSMLPMLIKELVEKRKWLTDKEVTELFSISQCLPGIIAANTALFVGYKQKKVLGGIVAALGVATPSVIIILIVATFLSNLSDIPVVQSAFVGLRICVSVLIINAVLRLRKHSIIDIPSALLYIVALVIAILTNIHIAIIVFFAGVMGVAISMLRKNSKSNSPK